MGGGRWQVVGVAGSGRWQEVGVAGSGRWEVGPEKW